MLEMLQDMGWTVVEVEGLRALASIARDVGVVLIRSGASPDEVARVADRLLLDQVPASQPPR